MNFRVRTVTLEDMVQLRLRRSMQKLAEWSSVLSHVFRIFFRIFFHVDPGLLSQHAYKLYKTNRYIVFAEPLFRPSGRSP